MNNFPGYYIALDTFEGPLDLLLHLVRRHELDIFDIPIAFVTEKYLEHLDAMKTLQIDIAGEYLLMAATLAYIKSRDLLPSSQDDDTENTDDDAMDPREELIKRLLDYQKYKTAADHISQMTVIGKDTWTRGIEHKTAASKGADDAELPLREVPIVNLLIAFENILKQAKINISHTVTMETLSVAERINQMVEWIDEKGITSFRSCFVIDSSNGMLLITKQEVVVTFLAILEMVRLKMIQITQAFHHADIMIERSKDLTEKSDELEL